MKDLLSLKREFLEYCELDKGQSLLTIQNYDRYLERFLKFLSKLKESQVLSPESEVSIPGSQVSNPNNQGSGPNPKPSTLNPKPLMPTDITQEVVRQYRLYINRLRDRKGEELKKTTQNYHILALRSFLRYLAFQGIESLPPEKVSVAKQGDRQITFLESDELSTILNSPDITKISGLRDRAILEVFFSTGLRVSELAALNFSDISFERNEISIIGKGRKARVVFLSDEAIYWLDQYMKNRGFPKKDENEKTDDPLFLSKKGERLTVRSIERLVKGYAVKAGLSKNVTPHTLRHSFATDLMMAGADIRSVQSLLGHSSITTTQIYTHVTDQHLREVHQRFHGKKLDEEPKKKV